MNLDLARLYFPSMYSAGEPFDPASKFVGIGGGIPSSYKGQSYNDIALDMFKKDLGGLGFATTNQLNTQIGDLQRKFQPAVVSDPPNVPIPTTGNPTTGVQNPVAGQTGTNQFGRPLFDLGQGGYTPQRPDDMVVPPYRQNPYQNPYNSPYQSPYSSYNRNPYSSFMQPQYSPYGGMYGMPQRQWQNQQQFRYGYNQPETGGQSYTPAPQPRYAQPQQAQPQMGGSMGSR